MSAMSVLLTRNARASATVWPAGRIAGAGVMSSPMVSSMPERTALVAASSGAALATRWEATAAACSLGSRERMNWISSAGSLTRISAASSGVSLLTVSTSSVIPRFSGM